LKDSNQQPTADRRCFRHHFEKPDPYCRLCAAKREAGGNFEQARKLFVPKKKSESREF
jgi:hypothetical protein